MAPKHYKILLTGQPGCGKTTAVMKIIDNLAWHGHPGRARAGSPCHLKVAGFYTKEIRQKNVRKGFSWKRLDGAEGTLAHVDIKGRFKVGKYGVDIEGFDKNVVPVLDIEQTDVKLFVIDEIGKMECFSKKFIAAIRRLFESDKPVLATVARKGPGLISEVKNYPNIQLFTLTTANREKVAAEILERLSSLKKLRD
jgi:nucleoside-triphosphatase